jgi:hypothetical protein
MLPPGIRGSISLYKITNDLLKRGYYVFISSTPNAPFDMVLSDGKNMKRIEATTGSYTSKGKICYPTKDKNKSDIIAVVINDNIHYFPKL